MRLVGIAEETLAIMERGSYTAPSGREVPLRAEIDAAVRGTKLHSPRDFEALLAALRPGAPADIRVEVTGETTGEAGRRLVQKEGETRVVALNFASAKNPGGGFLRGARAQEEDLARCSALYPCLLPQHPYYEENRRERSLLYTDHMIHSPDVPFFRDENLNLLEAPFLLSIITAPAPNAGEALARDPALGEAIRGTLEARAHKVLAVAAVHGDSRLILGAWGCGVFRNDPGDVAQAFAKALADERLRGAFARVVFAVYDRGGRNRSAFEQQFGAERAG